MKIKQNIYYVEEELPMGKKLDDKVLFSEYAQLWLEENKATLSPKTFSRYQTLLVRINMGIGHLPLGKITSHHLNLFYKNLSQNGANLTTGGKLSQKTILHHHRLISVILQSATREQIIPTNPASRDSIKPPSAGRTEVVAYKIEDLKKLLSSLGEMTPQMKMVTTFLITTGMRRGEALALKWGDIDSQNKTISINKNAIYTAESGVVVKEPKTQTSTRVIRYDDKLLCNALDEYAVWYKNTIAPIKDDKFMFINEMTGKLIHPDTVTKSLKKHCEKFKLPHCYPHMLRHTYVSMMIAMNVPIKEISTNVGHAQLTTTCNVYAHQIALHTAKPLTPVENLIFAEEFSDKEKG